jgi:hypothetical protein
MPIFVYEELLPDGGAGQTLERFEQRSDPPLTHHPVSGLPVRRVFAARTEGDSTKAEPEARAGFTKYEKVAPGKWEKRFGRGPATIKK